ncbi:MAG TPA: hypothetical protein VEB68_14210 [Croceibacterium sp.]|nr:hypothetical protein [Croceibacterium sp.]
MHKALLAAAAIGLLGGCDRGPEPPEKTVQQLMAQEVQPTAKIYWDSVQYISDETGNHEIFPETDADWQRTRAAATKMAELAALLKEPGYADGRGKDWLQFSDSLAEVSRLAEQAADERSTDKVFEVGGTMYSVCSACHQAYPAESEEGAAPTAAPEA